MVCHCHRFCFYGLQCIDLNIMDKIRMIKGSEEISGKYEKLFNKI